MNDASYKVSFDTLQIVDDISVPHGKWGTADYLEPITRDYPEYGPGGATQAITHSQIRIDSIEQLPKKKGVQMYTHSEQEKKLSLKIVKDIFIDEDEETCLTIANKILRITDMIGGDYSDKTLRSVAKSYFRTLHNDYSSKDM